MNGFYKLIKTWKLPVSMLMGVVIYFVVRALLHDAEAEVEFYDTVSHIIQPCLIFSMLFLSFLKVEPGELRPHRWHSMLLLVQGAFMTVCALIATLPSLTLSTKILMEGAMLCFLCPTATASAVIVQKLDGSLSGCVSYLILCNLMVSLLAPYLITMVEPTATVGHFTIMAKVFPLLLCPLFTALLVRRYLPKVMKVMLRVRDLAFYLWLVALALAITVTVRIIINTHVSLSLLAGLAVVSLIGCLIQFWLGRKIGGVFGSEACDSLTAGQAFGQKNTVFIIWLGYVFLNPVTSVVGGFYSIWHNVINSWQLYKKEKN